MEVRVVYLWGSTGSCLHGHPDNFTFENMMKNVSMKNQFSRGGQGWERERQKGKRKEREEEGREAERRARLAILPDRLMGEVPRLV